ncbi:MAG: hypothetical protein ACE3JK_02645 [Sporolactobacillus sp.]
MALTDFLAKEVTYIFNLPDSHVVQLEMSIDNFEGRRYITGFYLDDADLNAKPNVSINELCDPTPYGGLNNGYNEITASLKYSAIILQMGVGSNIATRYLCLCYLPDINKYIVLSLLIAIEDGSPANNCEYILLNNKI